MARPIIKNAQDAIDYVVQNNIDNVKLGIFDVDGVCRGKYLNRDKFISAVKNGFAFCDVVLAVSYTHLDVYKRQGLTFSSGLFWH